MPAGEVTALIGPSGCGKSTFLRLLNRMHELVPGAALDGEILLDGEDIYAPRHAGPAGAHAHRHGVPEAEPVPGHEHPRERARRASSWPGIKCHDTDGLVEQSLERAGLWREVRDRLDSPGGALSGGQQQRLCIARSLAVQPNVLLMDEPCSALDPTSTRRIEETIAELRDEVTVVIVTHNMQQAQRVSDRCAFFLAAENEPGRVVEQGADREDVLRPRRPAHARLRRRAASDEHAAASTRSWRAGRGRRLRRRRALALGRRARRRRPPPPRADQRPGLDLRRPWPCSSGSPTRRPRASTVNYLPTGSPAGPDAFADRSVDFAGTEAEFSRARRRRRRRRAAATSTCPTSPAPWRSCTTSRTRPGGKVDYLHLSRATVAKHLHGRHHPLVRPGDHRRQPAASCCPTSRSTSSTAAASRARPRSSTTSSQQHRARALRPVGGAQPAADRRPHHPARQHARASRRRRTALNGSDQIAQYVASDAGKWSIAYDEFGYAKTYGADAAWVQNAVGRVGAALRREHLGRPRVGDAAARPQPGALAASTRATNPDAYPISAYSYIVTQCAPRGRPADLQGRVPEPRAWPRRSRAWMRYIACEGQVNMARDRLLAAPAQPVAGDRQLHRRACGASAPETLDRRQLRQPAVPRLARGGRGEPAGSVGRPHRPERRLVADARRASRRRRGRKPGGRRTRAPPATRARSSASAVVATTGVTRDRSPTRARASPAPTRSR